MLRSVKALADWLVISGAKNGLLRLRNVTATAVVLAVTSNCVVGCHDRPDPRDNPPPTKNITPQLEVESQVTLETADGWKLYGDMVLPADKPIGAVIMLHQRGGTSADWKPLSDALRNAGVASLALDQRGFGRSLGAASENGENAPWDTSKDIAAAVKYLKDQKFRGHIGIIGASYGANNALIYAASSGRETDIKTVSLLSPGDDYHNLDAAKAAKTWMGPLQIVYGRNDTVAGLGPINVRENSPSHDKVVNQFDTDRHGTELLDSETIDACVLFLSRTLK